MTKSSETPRVVPPWALRAKALMKSQRITQQDMADAIGMERNTVSHYLNGHREPSIETVAAIAARLGVKTSHLVGDIPLTHDELQTQEILRLFQAADKERRDLLVKMAQAALDH